MRDRIDRAILKTLIYSDIFDYPLIKEEIWKFLISERPLRPREFEKELDKLSGTKLVHLEGGRFYCLSGRSAIVTARLKREKESYRKLKIAQGVIKKISTIPTVQLIGISGALSLKNSERDDDIDLFVIPSKGTIWSTRLAMIILLLIIGRYRRRNQRQVSDKICLNMLIDESALSFPEKRQDLYTAHEIAQLMPVFERNNTYNKFINANGWVERFLPNAFGRIKNQESRIKNKNHNSCFMLHNSLFIFELFAKLIQLWSIRKHTTNETVSDNLLAFHPLDYKKKVLSGYNRRLRDYEKI